MAMPYRDCPQPHLMANQQDPHFLVVTFEAQGHINPARLLARRLIRSTSSRTRATLAVPASAFRRMFPNSAGEDVEESNGLFSYTPYSNVSDADHHKTELSIKEGITRLVLDLAAKGRPVTCIIYTILLTIVSDAARELGIPSVLFWIQPAALFTIYHRYFHGYADRVASHKNDPMFPVELPGLPPLNIRDLPSFLTSSEANPYFFIYFLFEDMFRALDREPDCRILVNTFQELEEDMVSSVDGVEMIPIGPLVEENTSTTTSVGGGDLFEEKLKGYMEWLDSKDERSVVYVSFGSVAKLSRRQVEEISRGLAESGRPYLLVLRQDNRGGGGDEEEVEGGGTGMVVEWCSQVKVLRHRSVGCFVTHCGWNSVIESLGCGVPMVMVPQWSDQTTNARLAEGEWGVGVRAEVRGEEGVVEGTELRRCLDVVMGDGERGVEIRDKAAIWRDKAVEAIGEGGSSSRNLKAFLGSQGPTV